MRRLLACAVAVLSLAAIGDVPARRLACEADSECVITRFEGCCPPCGCGLKAYAIHAADLKSDQARCASDDCVRKRCEPVACVAPEQSSSYRS